MMMTKMNPTTQKKLVDAFVKLASEVVQTSQDQNDAIEKAKNDRLSITRRAATAAGKSGIGKEDLKDISKEAVTTWEKSHNAKLAPAVGTYIKQGMFLGKDGFKAVEDQAKAALAKVQEVKEGARIRDVTFKVLSMTYNDEGKVPSVKAIVDQHQTKFDLVKYLDGVAAKLRKEGVQGAQSIFAEGFDAYGEEIERRKAEAAQAAAEKKAKAEKAKAKASKAKTEEVAADAESGAGEVDDLAASLAALSDDQKAALLKSLLSTK